ncbi:response regulator [Sulfurimonas sp.]|uniref:response regulator n=1 Tax=Sulfurimonas sp. TaxID=2022749 RepID=UPI00356146F8
MYDNKHILNSLNNLELLYIENKYDFRKQVSDILEEHFTNVYNTQNADEAIDIFRTHKPKIVIIDIDDRRYDWVKTVTRIKDIKSNTKIILISKFDAHIMLMEAINLGVTKFLVKPATPTELSDAINFCIQQLQHENDIKIFNTYVYNIYNHDKSMLIMLKNGRPVVANHIFLNFFNVESVKEFNYKYPDLGEFFLHHEGYLFSQLNNYWLDNAKAHHNNLFHVQIKNKRGEPRHFLFKYHLISQEKAYAILSFDDVTELDLTKTLDTEKAHNESKTKLLEKDKENVYNLLELLQKSKVKVHVHNYYKGLTIVHDAEIIDVKENSITITTVYLQQKAIQIDKRAIITSPVLPYSIVCNKVVKIDYKKHTVELGDLEFSRTSPALRKTIRLSPNSKYSVSLFINNQRYKTDISIIDISIESVNLKFEDVPLNLKKNDKVTIDIIFNIDNKPLIINSEAIVLREAQEQHNSNVVFLLNLNINQKNHLLKYIKNRQVEIIKEFKNMKDKTL